MLRALASATALTPPPQGGAPQWVHLIPAGTVTTVDGRGPYHVGDAAALARESLQAAGGKLPIDENHSTDLAAPSGAPSPARGWIVALEARADGIWGQVEWTKSGEALLTDHAYRGISPVFIHDKQMNVLRILRAALVNTPNLRGLAALHSEEIGMEELMKALRTALGLAADADQAAVMQSIQTLRSGTALQSVLNPVARAAGLKEGADAGAILAAVKAIAGEDGTTVLQAIASAVGLRQSSHATEVLAAVKALAAKNVDGAAVTALQAELKDVTTRFAALQTQLATDKATAFVDAAIAAGRVGVKPVREHYIARHAASAEGAAAVEKEIGAMPVLGPSGALPTPPAKDKDGNVALNAEQMAAAKALGINPKEYQKTLAAEAAQKEAV